LLGKPGQAVSDAAIISIDRLGTDVRMRLGTEYIVKRMGFDEVCAALTPTLYSTTPQFLILQPLFQIPDSGPLSSSTAIPSKAMFPDRSIRMMAL